MPRFFVPAGAVDNGRVVLTGDDARHISYALRYKTGDRLTVCDGERVYDCVIRGMDGRSVTLSAEGETEASAEPSFALSLYTAMPKAGKIELIVQKAVELGASAIRPFVSRNCVWRPTERDGSKTERLNKIAAEAAKQCGRDAIPEVLEAAGFDEALAAAASADMALFCHTGNFTKSLTSALKCCINKGISISVMVGPEGGFTREEYENAVGAGLTGVNLGRRVLRCETAAIAVCSHIMLLSEDLRAAEITTTKTGVPYE